MSRLRRKKVDANNGSFSLDENDDTQDVTSVTDAAQAHKNFIEEISNATFVLDDGEQEQAHERVNLSLNISFTYNETSSDGYWPNWTKFYQLSGTIRRVIKYFLSIFKIG